MCTSQKRLDILWAPNQSFTREDDVVLPAWLFHEWRPQRSPATLKWCHASRILASPLCQSVCGSNSAMGRSRGTKVPSVPTPRNSRHSIRLRISQGVHMGGSLKTTTRSYTPYYSHILLNVLPQLTIFFCRLPYSHQAKLSFFSKATIKNITWKSGRVTFFIESGQCLQLSSQLRTLAFGKVTLS